MKRTTFIFLSILFALVLACALALKRGTNIVENVSISEDAHTQSLSKEYQKTSFENRSIIEPLSVTKPMPNVPESGRPPASLASTIGDQALDDLAIPAINGLGHISVPKEWLVKQSEFVKKAVKERCFVFDAKGLIGTRNEKGEFVSWPGAPSLKRNF
jgi:hypothetical protein